MNFIEFNDKNIYFFKKKGVCWIIVKSVCEALNVDFENQRKRINEDTILRSAPLNQTVQIPGDDQKRQYFCLPEEYVYGWIFSIQGNSEELLAYKKECYHVLFNHFHGIIPNRPNCTAKSPKNARKTPIAKTNFVKFPNIRNSLIPKCGLQGFGNRCAKQPPIPDSSTKMKIFNPN